MAAEQPDGPVPDHGDRPHDRTHDAHREEVAERQADQQGDDQQALEVRGLSCARVF